MYFSLPHIATVYEAFQHAETLTETYFGLGDRGLKAHKYEVKTLAQLEEHERSHGAFAHLCRYYYQKDGRINHPDNYYFFKICLQDDHILDAVKRGETYVKLAPLMLYIAIHELVHVVRFNRGDSDFDAACEARQEEEERVHSITRNILRPVPRSDLNLVLECFSDRYRLGDMFSLQ